MTKPFKDTLSTAALILAAGIIYYLIVLYTPFSLPCLIKLMTGFECPSCGITRMAVALLHLDFKAAFHYNPFVFFAWLPTCIEVLYIRYTYSAGKDIPKWNYAFIYALCGAALLFGILRNIY